MISLTLVFYFLLYLLPNFLGLQYTDDHVAQLTETNFEEFNSLLPVSFVKFYTPWCEKCEDLAPKFNKASRILKDIVGFGEVDNEKSSQLGSKYKITTYPSLLLFREGKADPILYTGDLDAKSLAQFAIENVKELIQLRAKKQGVKIDMASASNEDGKCGSRGSKYSGAGTESCSSGSSSRSDSSSGDSAVIDLTDDNFGRLVLESENDWLVSFYAPWCPHCKSLKPEWEEAAKKLKGKMKLGAVDATVYQGLAQRYSIQGFPTIKYFPAGEKTGAPEDYSGGRSASEIVSWSLRLAAKNKPPPEVKELTGNSVLRDGCTDRQLCIIAVLPDLLDCQSTCRLEYLATLKSSAEKFKQNDWGWVWTSSGKHLDLEDALNIGGFGYPALAAVNARKQKCAVMRGSFSSNGLNEFFRDLSLGRGSVPLIPVSELPELNSVKAWDGNDAAIPQDFDRQKEEDDEEEDREEL